MSILGRNSSGERPSNSHFRIFNGADGFAHGSAWLTEIWPPLAKLVSSPAPGCRSMTQTLRPARIAQYAVLMPTTPAPSTITSKSLSVEERNSEAGRLSMAFLLAIASTHAPSVMSLRVSPLRLRLAPTADRHAGRSPDCCHIAGPGT